MPRLGYGIHLLKTSLNFLSIIFVNICSLYTVPWSYQGIRLDTDKNYAFSQVLIWICLDSKDDSTLNPEPRSKQID